MIHELYRLRLGDTADTAYVTARIVDQSAVDGSTLDSPLSLDYCGTNTDCTVALANANGQPAAITNTGQRNGTSAKGGNGSGGVFPFSGGLPLHLPSLGLPTVPTWLYWAAGGFAALLVIHEARR